MKHTIVPMKTIGLLGGMSSQATKEYYELINEGVNKIKGEHNAAEILIYSVNFQNIERFVRNAQWEEAGAYLSEKAQQLEKGEADFLLLGTNTMHRVAHYIVEAITIPFISIIDTACEAIRQKGLSKVGMLGTRPTMEDEFFQDAYRKLGVELVTPLEEERKEIDRIIFDEMCHNIFRPESKAYYRQVITHLHERGAEGIVLGCTEIKLLINQEDVPDIPLFDTTTLHCNKAVNLCLSVE